MGAFIRSTIRACALGLAALPALGAQVVDPAAARRAAAQPQVVATDIQLSALAAEGRVSELALRVLRIASDRTLEPAAREWLLDRGLHELARLSPTPEALAAVRGLTGRRPEVLTRVDPDHGDRAVPMYDTGATARFVLRAWQRAEARAAAAAELAAGSAAAVARFAAPGSSPSDPAREGIAEAYAVAPIAQLHAQRAAVAAALSQGRNADGLALVLATRLADAALAELVLGHAEPPVALAAVRAIPGTFDAQTALGLLRTASRRADVASAATLQIGALARQDGAARALLHELMSDRELGPSAAAALAAAGDAGESGRRLRAAESDWLQRMYVLALKLDPAPGAREELRRFAAMNRGAASLRSEVQQWLAH